jgi:hypothetical protein
MYVSKSGIPKYSFIESLKDFEEPYFFLMFLSFFLTSLLVSILFFESKLI